jgi:hypothetical protein
MAASITIYGTSDLLPFGATIALLIAALAYFLGRSQHE